MPEREPRLHFLLLPLAACIAILPLILRGCSCGHDFDFHLLNWFEAARQFTHGTHHPTWAYTAAWNAGEPRFIFYPPLSWVLGAALTLILPASAAPIVYTWLALTAAGFALYYLARTFAPPTAALLAATFYIVNPYTLFTAYERTAYAELLAAAAIPLLLHAILRDRVTALRIAIPLTFLWLTNAPAAVMASYTLALLALIRFFQTKDRIGLTRETVGGTLLGLALAAFYIVPAAYQRRFVQINMAILPSLHPQDNFLFHHTGTSPDDILHDQVLHTASIIAVILIACTIVALALAKAERKPESRDTLLLSLTILTLAITFFLTPLSAPFWHYLPELRFLQFPWRLLAILAPTLSLTLALALSRITLKPATIAIAVVAIAAVLTYPAYTAFHQSCDPEDTATARLAHFRAGQTGGNPGAEPTDEYTPIAADNDALATANPPYWLADSADTPAPNQTTPGPAPTSLRLNLTNPQVLILNLRDYPTWNILRNDTPITARLPREDGLIAIPLPAGPSEINIYSAHTGDQTVGNLITGIAVLVLYALFHRPKP